jgi:ABC-type multidrug transport system ATPase subunit
MEATLDFFTPEGNLKSFPLPRDALTIGAAPDDAIVITAEGVFPRQASLSWHPNHATWVLSRLHDGGRLSVNNKELLPRLFVPLSHLDVISIGGVEGRFQKAPQPPLLAGKPCRELALEGRLVTIGRLSGQNADGEGMRLDLDPDDSGISKDHTLVGWRMGAYHIEDRSKFGTQLNGQAFDKRVLVPGDRFRIRDYFFEFTGSSIMWVDHAAGATIEARGASVEVVSRTGEMFPILRNVSLRIRAGEFLGVLGGSGQGKSTLLNVLSGLVEPVRGGVMINKLPPAEFAAQGEGIGYVPQDDIVHRNISVEQALLFSARLRAVMDGPALQSLVKGILQRLRLDEHEDKLISKLSGGQRKRVNIASELLSRPTVLFLDEPTSGLDPAMEEELMSLLQNLKITGQTIVCTTHVLHKAYLFDRIAFIHSGRLLFMGTPSEARNHFFDRDETGTHATGSHGNAPLERIFGIFKDNKQDVEAWESRFLASPLAPFAKAEPPPPRSMTGGDLVVRKPRAWTHFRVLVERQWSILISDRRDLLSVIAQPIVIGLLAGTVGLEDPEFRLFACLIATFWFGCSNAVQEICGELPIFRRERVSGVGLHSYIFSKVFFRSVITLVQSAILLVSQMLVVFLGSLFFSGEGNPAYTLFPGATAVAAGAFVLASAVAVFLGLSISAHARSNTQAVMWVPLILIPQILFSGFVVPLAEMKGPVRVLSKIIPSGAAQRLVDVAWVDGKQVPLLVHCSVKPMFWWTSWSDGELKKQEINAVSGKADGDGIARDLDEFNTAWSNMLFQPSDEGGATKATEGDMMTKSRTDVRPALDGGTFMSSALTLLFWAILCYSSIWFGLCLSQPHSYAPIWARRFSSRVKR